MDVRPADGVRGMEAYCLACTGRSYAQTPAREKRGLRIPLSTFPLSATMSLAAKNVRYRQTAGDMLLAAAWYVLVWANAKQRARETKKGGHILEPAFRISTLENAIRRRYPRRD